MTSDQTRWCRRGDTISTVRPLGDGQHLHVVCPNAESCAEANELIFAGRWRVSRCGQCDQIVEVCRCARSPSFPSFPSVTKAL